jgi:hypothetical protein
MSYYNDGGEYDDEPQEARRPEIPPVNVAAKTNRTGTVKVRATNQGMPVEVVVDRSELRYGGGQLAQEILRLTRAAAAEAGMRRRELLAEQGVAADILDSLGLPDRRKNDDDETDYTPQSWLRKV